MHPRPPLGAWRRLACSSSGSAMIEPTVIRGFRLACGSWKIICIFGRSARSAPPSSRAMSRPSSSIAPAGRVVEPQDRPPGRRLAAARLADEPERLALGDVEADVVDRLDLADLAPEHALVDREVHLQPVDAEQRLRPQATRRGPPVAGSHQQAASWPGPTGSRGGFSVRQRLKTWRAARRERAGRRLGHQHRRLALDGAQPPRPRAPMTLGTVPSSARV